MTRFSYDITEVLISAYEDDPYPSDEECRRMAKATGLKPTQVQTWFNNRQKTGPLKRLGLREKQRRGLLEVWNKLGPYPSPDTYRKLGEKLDLTLKQVHSWFSGKRFTTGTVTRRHRFKHSQVRLLETYQPYPSDEIITKLAKKLESSEYLVRQWFSRAHYSQSNRVGKKHKQPNPSEVIHSQQEASSSPTTIDNCCNEISENFQNEQFCSSPPGANESDELETTGDTTMNEQFTGDLHQNSTCDCLSLQLNNAGENQSVAIPNQDAVPPTFDNCCNAISENYPNEQFHSSSSEPVGYIFATNETGEPEKARDDTTVVNEQSNETFEGGESQQIACSSSLALQFNSVGENQICLDPSVADISHQDATHTPEPVEYLTLAVINSNGELEKIGDTTLIGQSNGTTQDESQQMVSSNYHAINSNQSSILTSLSSGLQMSFAYIYNALHAFEQANEEKQQNTDQLMKDFAVRLTNQDCKIEQMQNDISRMMQHMNLSPSVPYNSSEWIQAAGNCFPSPPLSDFNVPDLSTYSRPGMTTDNSHIPGQPENIVELDYEQFQ